MAMRVRRRMGDSGRQNASRTETRIVVSGASGATDDGLDLGRNGCSGEAGTEGLGRAERDQTEGAAEVLGGVHGKESLH